MKRLLVAALAFLAACAPDIPNTPPTAVVTARFDPSATPPVVPSPNDLATNPKTGLLAVTLPTGATGADRAFVAWLNTLDGFPAAAAASVTFDGALAPTSVAAGTSVRVFDVASPGTALAATVSYADVDDAKAPGRVTVTAPAGGWEPGHRYAIAVIGGDKGVKAADGRPVVGSATWAFIRSENPLVTCDDLTSADCAPTTEIIPSAEKSDQAKRLADQTAKALQLEALRRKYKPLIDGLIAGGVARGDIAILWTFKVAQNPAFEFNPAATPPRVPSPTNLVLSNGKLNVPIDPASSPAYQEFVRDYLNELNGFPTSTAALAHVVGGAVDPDSVNEDSVLVFDVSGEDLPGEPAIAFDEATGSISVTPPNSGWGRGRTIAVAVLGGADGVRSADGLGLVASDAWAFARSASPLVDCATLGPDCHSTVTMTELSDAQAVGLEGLRRAYKPVLDLLASEGVARADVSGLWVFTTVDQPAMTFDLGAASPVIPFPSNQFLRTADDVSPTGHLAFPVPAGPTADLFTGLNTLNGFSTTAPIVSENAADLGALDEGSIDPDTLEDGVGFAKLTGAGPLTPHVKACLNCTSSVSADPDADPQPEQLQWVPEVPLEELSRYGAWVTGELTDTDGRRVMPSPTFALVRLKNSLLDAEGKSTLPVISDAQAQALEPYRVRFEGCLDDIATQGIERKDVALAFCVTTQSTTSVLRQISGAISLLPASALPDVPTMLVDTTTPMKAAMTSLGIPSAAIQNIFTGNLVLPFGLNGPAGTLNPNQSQWSGRKAPFLLFLPAGTAPAGGWPVVIYGHGLTRTRNDAMVVANALASGGFATVAIDVVFHGDRTTCVDSPAGAQACAAGSTCDADTGRCVASTGAADCNPATNGDAVCFAAGQGQCRLTGKCENGDFRRDAEGKPAIAAWNYLNLVNLFATRDNFRYTGSVDFTQLTRVLRSTSAASLNAQLALMGAALVDGNTIHYVGQSLGTFNGNVFAAASGVPSRLALNVPGASQVDVLLTAPGFAAQRAGFLGTLAATGLEPGSPGFDQFIVLARTIMDPSDPQNLIYDGVHSTNTGRKIFLQSIEGDQVLPNATADMLEAAANQDSAHQALVFRFEERSGGTPQAGTIPASYPLENRHGFLLNPAGNSDCNSMNASCATVAAQTQIVTFLLTGTP